MRSRSGGHDASPRSGHPGLHAPIRAEQTKKRDAIAERHFQSNLSSQVGWYVIVDFCRIALDDVNVVLLQHSPNLLSFLRVHASNTNTTLDLTVTVLNNFELKRDAVQTENDFPAQ